MKRRDFLGEALKKGTALVLAPAAVVATLPGTAAALEQTDEGFSRVAPVAPLGPPPLCAYPRGLYAKATPARGVFLTAEQEAMRPVLRTIPPDWFLLKSWMVMGAMIRKQRGLSEPATWREATDAISAAAEDVDPGGHRGSFLDDLARCGLDPDDAPPENLDELADLCQEWAFGQGRFAEGVWYRNAHPAATAADICETLPDSFREMVREEYEEAGSPFGLTETGAWIWFGDRIAAKGGWRWGS